MVVDLLEEFIGSVVIHQKVVELRVVAILLDDSLNGPEPGSFVGVELFGEMFLYVSSELGETGLITHVP